MIDSAEITQHEGLAQVIARNYFPPPGWTHADLMQEARIGIYKGLRDFDETGGASKRNFIALCITRQVITAIKAATRGKQSVLNHASSVGTGPDGEQIELLDLAPAPNTDALGILETRAELEELARAIRERLSDTECACLLGWLNGESYEQTASRLRISFKAVDTAMSRARVKLTGRSAPSKVALITAQRRGATGYTCPSCGGATVKKPGRGRPPRCNVCRTRPTRLAA